jgi:hypothetical protein
VSDALLGVLLHAVEEGLFLDDLADVLVDELVAT